MLPPSELSSLNSCHNWGNWEMWRSKHSFPSCNKEEKDIFSLLSTKKREFSQSFLRRLLSIQLYVCGRGNTPAGAKDPSETLVFPEICALNAAFSSFQISYVCQLTSQVALVVKNPPANAGDVRGAGSIPGSGRSPGGGHGLSHSSILAGGTQDLGIRHPISLC